MWAAASGDADCHLLQWLEARAERLPPMRVGDEQISGHATVAHQLGSVVQHIAVVGHHFTGAFRSVDPHQGFRLVWRWHA